MNTNHKYALYCNNIATSIIEDIRLQLYSIEPSISFDIIEINNKDGEASKGIPAVGISLYCYFITNKELKHIPASTKIYDSGMGYGICLLNIDLDNFSKQFDLTESFDRVIKFTINKLKGSINFCEKYINVNF